MNIKAELEKNGYAIIENVLSEEELRTAKEYFYEWIRENPNIEKLHEKVDPHGIFKFFGVGGQRHTWYIKTLEKVQKPFKEIWNTDDLVVSFDGTCWVKPDFKGKDNTWTHTDQAPRTKGLQCIQAFVALTDNTERTFRVYEGSHLMHEQYMAEQELTHGKNWQKIEPDYLETIKDKRRVLHVKAGSMVLWDSRSFHQNQYGDINCGEERLVQYVCYLPKNHAKNTKQMHEKRLKYYAQRRTTSHWPYPIHVNGLQPRTFGNKDLEIDYTVLKDTDLSDLEEKIMEIL